MATQPIDPTTLPVDDPIPTPIDPQIPSPTDPTAPGVQPSEPAPPSEPIAQDGFNA